MSNARNDRKPQGLTRRELIKRSVIFSAAALTPAWLHRAGAIPARQQFIEGGVHLLAMGDYGTGNENQIAVAQQMAVFAQNLKAPLNGVLAIGDNFYNKITPERFDRHFEQMYSPEHLNVPFYACAGNHDYGTAKYDFQEGKLAMQLDYARQNPKSRWKMPSKWYTLEFPDAKNPLVRMIVLDGNYWLGALTPQEKLEQERFFAAELKRKTSAPWTWMVNHFPLFSNSTHGDNDELIQRWGPLLQNSPVSICLAGHDHTLQHLEIESYRSSFIVSGAGGAGLYKIKRNDRGSYSNSILGFNHFHITPNWVDVQYIDKDGERLHGFRRHLNGRIELT